MKFRAAIFFFFLPLLHCGPCGSVTSEQPRTSTAELVSHSSPQEWLDERTSGIGGSDIGAIMGHSPWASAVTVWAEKMNLYAKEVTPAMERGKLLEPCVLDAYKEKRCLDVYYRPDSFFQSTQSPIFRSSVDGLAESEKIVVEIKTSRHGRKYWGKPGTNDVPDYVRAQVQWAMGVLGPEWKTVEIAAFFGEAEPEICLPEIYRIQRDDEHIAEMQKAALDFWRKIEAEKCPEPRDGLKETMKALTAVYRLGREGEIKDQIVEADDLARQAIEQCEEAIRAGDDMKKEMLRNKIRYFIGESGAKGIRAGNIAYTWSPDRNDVWKLLRKH
jgi:putative phage-type endonuclease